MFGFVLGPACNLFAGVRGESLRRGEAIDLFPPGCRSGAVARFRAGADRWVLGCLRVVVGRERVVVGAVDREGAVREREGAVARDREGCVAREREGVERERDGVLRVDLLRDGAALGRDRERLADDLELWLRPPPPLRAPPELPRPPPLRPLGPFASASSNVKRPNRRTTTTTINLWHQACMTYSSLSTFRKRRPSIC